MQLPKINLRVFIALLGLCLCLLGFQASLAMAQDTGGLQAIPAYSAPVVDTANLLSAAERQSLIDRLLLLQQQKDTQVAVLTVTTTAPEAIEQYAIRVAEAWRVGRSKVDDGVLLLVASEDRAVRIEVGYGLEGVIPDILAARIIKQAIVPAFRANNSYAQGINAGIDNIIAAINNEHLPLPEQQQTEGNSGLGLFAPLLMLLMVIGEPIKRLFGVVPSGLVVGLLAAGISWFFGASMLFVGLAGFVAFVVMLMPRSSFIGGGGGGGGGGGFGGGGFGGGSGGGFGGGGASGRW